jgi:hypothetical protein
MWTIRVTDGKASRDFREDTKAKAFKLATQHRQRLATARKSTIGTIQIKRMPQMYCVFAK